MHGRLRNPPAFLVVLLTSASSLRLAATPQRSRRARVPESRAWAGDRAQVIPKPGGTVRVLVGPLAGEAATVTAVLKDRYQVELELPSGAKVLSEYEHVSKKAT